MYKISIAQDIRVPIIFLDAVTLIPGIHEDSGAAGETAQRTFVNLFNTNYAPIAEKAIVDGNEVVLVKAIYDDLKMGESLPIPREITKQEARDMASSTIITWRKLFHLTDAEIKKFWHDMIKRQFIIK